MKVLLTHSRYRSAAPSGENIVVDQEADALRAAGHDVALFERRSDEIVGWTPAQKLALPARTLWNEEVRRDLRTRLEDDRPDVIHVHNTFPLLSPSVLYAGRDAGVPVVATLHNYKLLCASGDFFRDGGPCHDCAGGSALPALRHGCYRGSRLATAPVVVSQALHRSSWKQLVSAYVFISAAQRDLMRHLDLPSDRVFVKHNFVTSLCLEPSETEHLIAYLGRLDEAKGIRFLMRAWDRFRLDHPGSRLRLVVAGGGPLAEDVNRWGAGHSSVEVVGNLPAVDAMQLLGRAAAAVVPSQWEETFGLVAVEAMASGVPPIAPARGSFPELIEDGKTGVLYKPGDAVALARVFEDVDLRPDEYRARGRRGRAEFQRRFQAGPNVEELLDIYRFAIGNPRT